MVRQRSIRVNDDFRKRTGPYSNCQASHYKFPVHPLLTLQKTSGNYAVQRLLGNRVIQAKLRQPGEAHEKEARLVVEQFMRAPTAAFGGGPAFPKCPVSKHAPVQRKSDGERNLESPRFTGDPLLEKILDGADEMSRQKNNSGPSVRKVQQALMDAGYSLPKFGADGKFGEETEGTLTIFQLTAGLDSGLNQGKGLADGVVRSQTILRLDQIFPSGAKPAGTPPPEKEDFLIKDKFQPSLIHFRRFFFDYDSNELDFDEKIKAELIVALLSPEEPLDLIGFASEEGSPSYNRGLAQRRIEIVDQALKGAGHQATRASVPRSEEGTGQLDYRFFRAVEVVRAGSKPGSKPGDKKKNPPVTDCGTTVTSALTKAEEMLEKAIEASKNPKEEDTEKALELFRGASAAPKLNPKLTALRNHLRDNVSKTHACADESDSRCGSTTMGINIGVGPKAVVTLCPSFMDETDVVVRADFLIHEATHGTEEIQSHDFARRFHRMIFALNQDVALKNADSYSLFIRLIDKPAKEPGSVKVGPTPKDKPVGLKGQELKKAQRALAFVEVWVDAAASDTGFLYDIIKKAREDRKWTASPYQFKMNLLAPRFGLSRPPRVPNVKDQNAVAAIHDRYALMRESVTRTPATGELSVIKSGVDSWETSGPTLISKGTAGAAVRLGPGFFGLSDAYQQVLFLFHLLVEGTPRISADLAPKYVEFADLNRQSNGFPKP